MGNACPVGGAGFASCRGEYPTEFKDEVLYRAAFVPTLALSLAGPLLGLARGGMELELASLTKGRGISHTFYEQAREAPSTQIQVAEAAQLIDTAALHLMRAADDVDDWAVSGQWALCEVAPHLD